MNSIWSVITNKLVTVTLHSHPVQGFPQAPGNNRSGGHDPGGVDHVLDLQHFVVGVPAHVEKINRDTDAR